jgi:hypothetical protein
MMPTVVQVMLLLIILNVLAVIGESMSWVKEAKYIMLPTSIHSCGCKALVG